MYRFARKWLFQIDPERAHGLASGAARIGQVLAPGLIHGAFGYEHPALHQELFGARFANPLGLAAGFDKNGELISFWQQLGFGFAEIGSVTARPSPGNPRPRLFRIPRDQGLINRMGLNNRGAAAVAEGLQVPRGYPVGINIAKTHDPAILGEAAVEDFRTSFRLLASSATYMAVNVSCPNTREGKTFETPDALEALLSALGTEREALQTRVPVLVKLSPAQEGADLGYLNELVQISLSAGVDGFILTNTAADRGGLRTAPDELSRIGSGGVSGKPLAGRSLRMLQYVRARTGGSLPLISCGGVFTAEDVYIRLRAGASLVQLYTGLIYEGPGVIKRILKGLVEQMERDSIAHIQDLVGLDAQVGTSYT